MMLHSKLANSVLAATALVLAFTSSTDAASLEDNIVNGQLFPQGRTPAHEGFGDYLSGVILVIFVPCRPRPAMRPS